MRLSQTDTKEQKGQKQYKNPGTNKLSEFQTFIPSPNSYFPEQKFDKLNISEIKKSRTQSKNEIVMLPYQTGYKAFQKGLGITMGFREHEKVKSKEADDPGPNQYLPNTSKTRSKSPSFKIAERIDYRGLIVPDFMK